MRGVFVWVLGALPPAGAAAGAPEWNFNKYLVDRDGTVVARFGAGTGPDAPELAERLDALL